MEYITKITRFLLMVKLDFCVQQELRVVKMTFNSKMFKIATYCLSYNLIKYIC